MRSILLIIFGIACMLLRVGFALQASGSLRSKNSVGVILRSIADAAAAALAFWAVGAGILFQSHNAWMGFDRHFLFQEPADWAGVEFFHLTLCLIGGAVITGALAERAKFYVSVAASAVLGGLVFPVIGHCIWFGKLHDFGFIDFGGATAIHLPAAIFGAVGVAVVGSRIGKYNRDGSSNSIPGHSLPMLGMGVLLIFVGWFPYLLGCISAHWPRDRAAPDDIAFGVGATNILLAGMSGAIGGLLYSHHRYRKPDLFYTLSGLLGALVAITPSVVIVTSLGAISIGLIAGILVPIIAIKLDEKAHLDDPVGLIAIHGTGAIWGTLAVAIFCPEIQILDHLRLLAIQSGGLAIVIVLSSLLATMLFLLLKRIGSVRAVESDEIEGLDVAEHGINSYPDFK